MLSTLSRSQPRLITLLAVLGLAIALVSLTVGPAGLSLGQTAGALFGMGEPGAIVIVQELRLPRVLLAATIGAVLALSGSALQGLLRNPLAAPDVLGAPGAAAFGAVLALALGLADTLSYALPVFAIVFAALSVAGLVVLAGQRADMLTLLLAGLALSGLWGALISLTLNLTSNLYAALEITFWLLGSLEDRSFRHVAMALPCFAISTALLLSTRGGLTALTLGEDVARSSGVDVARLTWLTLLGVATGIGAAVAVAGVIGFVGLVTPHLVRPFCGHDPARVHIPAMIAGADLLMAADLAARLVPAQAEIRIGVMTSLIGVPFFIWLVLQRRWRDLAQQPGRLG